MAEEAIEGIVPGQVVSTKAFKQVIGEDIGWVQYKALKGQKLTFLFLGTEDIKPGGKTINPIDALKAMGWSIDPKIEEMMREYNSDRNSL